MENSVCRICVEKTEPLKPISDVVVECENSNFTMLEILKLAVHFEVIDLNYHQICLECIKNATNCLKFKFQCEKSTEKFAEYCHIKTEYEEKFDGKSTDSINENSDDELPLIEFKIDEENSNIEINDEINYIEQNRNKPKEELNEEKLDEKPNLVNESSDDELPLITLKINEANIGINKEINNIKRTRRKPKESEEELKPCKFCNKLFRNKYALLAHEKRHENKGKFVCEECGKGFNSKGCLHRHTRVHTGEKKYQCKECQRCFPSANNLRLHSRRHNGIKPYLCTKCGKSFSHPTGLNYHLRTHTRERPYTCEICGKSFLIHTHLDRHAKIHTGERPFGCTQCSKAFIKKIDLQRHQVVHSGERPHICKICNKAFVRVLHLNYHMMVHTSERPHRCEICGKGFIRRYYLTDHLKKRHSEEVKIQG